MNLSRLLFRLCQKKTENLEDLFFVPSQKQKTVSKSSQQEHHHQNCQDEYRILVRQLVLDG